MWLGHVPWAGRPLGLAGAHRAGATRRGTTNSEDAGSKKLTDWARQMVMQLRRWHCPSGRWCWWATTATPCWIKLHCCQSLREPVTLIARLRLDAALYAPAPARQPGQQRPPAAERRAAAPVEGPPRPAIQVTWASVAVAWYEGAHLARWNSRRKRRSGTAPASLHPHPLGADPRSPGLLRHPGLAVHRPIGGLRPRSWNGS